MGPYGGGQAELLRVAAMLDYARAGDTVATAALHYRSGVRPPGLLSPTVDRCTGENLEKGSAALR